jgi:hypothetical protein
MIKLMKPILASFLFATAVCVSARAQITPLPPLPPPMPTPFATPIQMLPLTPVPYPSAAPAVVQPAAPAAAAAAPAAAAPAAPYSSRIRQWHGQFYQGERDGETRILATEGAWALFWKKTAGKQEPEALDGASEMAVYICIGERPTGGYVPRVTAIQTRPDRVVVIYNAGKPPEGSFVQEVITYPYVVAIIPRTSLPVVFQEGQ